jgi:PPM family protein phosphatase
VLRAFGVTDKGRVRPVNEDCFAVDSDLGLCVIADGMGGHNAGEVAARMVVDGVVEHVRRSASATSPVGLRLDASLLPFGVNPAVSAHTNVLRNAILLANIQILESAVRTPDYAGMGSTVVAAWIVNGRLGVASAGDSRLYLFTAGTLRRMTTDDSWIATLLATEPEADPAQYQHHPMRNALTNVVGGRVPTDVHVTEQPITGGEWLLLTTDGVHGVLNDQSLQQMMRNGDPPSIAAAIVAAALDGGSRDNCTVIVAAYS